MIRAVMAGIGLVGVAALTMGRKPSRPSAGLGRTSGGDHGDLRAYLLAADLAPSWVGFFEAVAAGESGFNFLRGLGRPELFPAWASPNMQASAAVQDREQRAAQTAYDRNRGRYSSCGFPEEEYVFGSGGWFGILPANGLAAFWGTSLACMSPVEVFRPPASVVMAIEMARRLMQWGTWKKHPTFGNLRLGWGDPSGMGRPENISRVDMKLKERYIQLGADPQLVTMSPPPLPPRDPVGMLTVLSSI